METNSLIANGSVNNCLFPEIPNIDSYLEEEPYSIMAVKPPVIIKFQDPPFNEFDELRGKD